MSHNSAIARDEATSSSADSPIPSVSTDINDYPRIAKLMRSLHPRRYPLCIEKALLVLESFKKSEGERQIVRRAKAVAHYLENRTIIIEDGELIVGNPAAKPMGFEAGSLGPTWPSEELDVLRKEMFDISDVDAQALRSLDHYWKDQMRTLPEKLASNYDDDRLWPFIQSGILLPPWRSKSEGRGQGAAEGAWGLSLGLTLIVVDFQKALTEGLGKISADAAEKLARIDDAASAEADFFRAVIITNKALVCIAHRYADLAASMARTEADPDRRRELQQIVEICRHVPENPPRNFRDALQAFWFLWLMVASGTASGGRFDQIMHPYYHRDRMREVLSDREALELLAALRIKVMQVNFLSGGAMQREKWSGLARWNNWVIGGVDRSGVDATNELSYLLLDAARLCPTPHHTLTLRVHERTPQPLLMRALDLVTMGLRR